MTRVRNLILKKQTIDQQVSHKVHFGEKRDQEVVLSEVMAEIDDAEKKFKFFSDMKISELSRHAFLDPPDRVSLRNPVAKLSFPPPGTDSPATSATDSAGSSVAPSAPSTPGRGSTNASESSPNPQSPDSRNLLAAWVVVAALLRCKVVEHGRAKAAELFFRPTHKVKRGSTWSKWSTK